MWIACDTNVLSLFATYGASALDVRFGPTSWEGLGMRSQYDRAQLDGEGQAPPPRAHRLPTTVLELMPAGRDRSLSRKPTDATRTCS